MDIPKLLRAYRGAKPQQIGNRTWYVGNLSQAEAARAVGVSVRNWQNWESGHRVPTGLALDALLARLRRRRGA